MKRYIFLALSIFDCLSAASLSQDQVIKFTGTATSFNYLLGIVEGIYAFNDLDALNEGFCPLIQKEVKQNLMKDFHENLSLNVRRWDKNGSVYICNHCKKLFKKVRAVHGHLRTHQVQKELQELSYVHSLRKKCNKKVLSPTQAINLSRPRILSGNIAAGILNLDIFHSKNQ